MAELQDFMLSPVSLQDFMPEEPTGTIANDRSKNNVAANIATLSEDPVATYTDVKFEMDNGTGDATRNSILTRLENEGIKANRQLFMDFMTRPDITDEERKIMAERLAGETAGTIRNDEDVLSEQALLQDDGVLTEEGFLTRDAQIDIYREANEYNAAAQNLINSQTAFTDQSTIKMVADIGEVIVPFLDQALTASLRKEMVDAGIDVAGGNASAFLLLGSTKAALADAFQKMPLSTRTELLTSIEQYVKSNDSVVLDSNGLFLADYLQTILIDGSYSTSDEWVDNVIGLLDIVGIGGAIRGVAKIGKAAKPAGRAEDVAEVLEDADDVIFPDERGVPTAPEGAPTKPQREEQVETGTDLDVGDIRTRTVTTEVIPTSPSQNLNRNNTGKGRQIHEASLTDETGEVAKVTSGAGPEDVAVHNLGPQITKVNGGVDAKLPTPNYIDDASVMFPGGRVVRNSDTPEGKIYYYNAEKLNERSVVMNDFQNAVGLNARPNMTSFNERPDGLDLGVVYGPINHGYNNPSEAMELVKYHLRDYGIKDENITLLQRGPSGYKPVSAPVSSLPNGDYLVQVDYTHKFSAKKGQVSGRRTETMISQRPEEFSFVDTIMETPLLSWLKPYLFNPEITLDSRLMAGAFTAVDETVSINKKLSDVFQVFIKGFKKLPKKRREAVTKALYEANFQGLAYTRAWASGKHGLTSREYDVILDFKAAQDQLYWLENDDYIRSLRNGGYGVWEDGNSRLIARPVARPQVKAGIEVMDPTTGTLKQYNTKQELTDLYKDGKTIAELRTPFPQNNKVVKYIVSQETMDQEYLRSFGDGDIILNYRPGYFKINYNSPIFIVEKMADGTLKAVATAEDIKSAELMVARMKGLNNGSDYFHRRDLKDVGLDPERANFDMASAQGRSSQRIRGKKLEEATTLGQPGVDANVMDPIQAFQSAAASISRRTSMRDYLEAFRTRLFTQYANVMPIKDGQRVYPKNVGEIADETGRNTKEVKQARSLYRYVNALEDSGNGSAIGDRTKAALHGVADMVGQHNSTIERKLRKAGDIDPVQFAAARAFELQVATNPLAQVITQTSGILWSAGSRPTFGYRPNGLFTQLWHTYAHMAGHRVADNALDFMGLTRAEWNDMMDAFERSGLFYAADINNLVRSGTREMVRQNQGVVASKYTAVVDKVREMGFDIGERANLMAGFLTKADEAREAGKLNDAEDWQRVAGEARALTFGMNEASQFAYQRNELRLSLQYFQVVHKALLWPFARSNRKQAAVMGPMIMLTFGAEGIPGIEQAAERFTEDFAKDPALWEARQVIMDGALQYMVNSALSLMTQTEVDLAVKERTSPFNYNDAQQAIRDLFSSDAIQFITESPSAQVGSKVLTAMADGLQFFNLTEDKLPESPMEFDAFVRSVASTFSAGSNSIKAFMALEYAKAFSANGYVTDQNVNKAEAYAKFFGFRTLDEARQFALNTDLRGEGSRESAGWSSEDDVKEWYKGVKRELFLSGEDPTNLESIKKIYGSIGNNLFQKNPANILILQKLIDRDSEQGDHQFVDGVLRAVGAGADEHEMKRIINRIPNLSREKRAEMLGMVDRVEALKRGEE